MRVYVAAGWFTPEQEQARKDILKACESHDLFSPKEDNLIFEGDDLKAGFEINLAEINRADIVVASTVGKDMGTIFECGYAYAMGIPVVYYAPRLDGLFNLMLAQSARSVHTTTTSLHASAQWDFPEQPYTGGIE